MHDRKCQNEMQLAMGYVLWHSWEELYEPTDALERGTAFPSLDMPFGKGGKQRCAD